MKKHLVYLFFILLLIGSVYALDCDYKVPAYSQIDKTVSYDGGTKFDYAFLEIKDIVYAGYQNPYWSWIYSSAGFKVYNNYNKKIIVNIFFVNNGNQENQSLEIDPLGFKGVDRGTTGNIKEGTIRFEFDNKNLSMTTEKIQVISGEQCRICEDTPCLNDNQTCEKDGQCGSTICNSINLCGHIRDVPCPEGRSLCDHKCVQRAIKSNGDSASCDFECKSGFLENKKCKTCENAECLKSGENCLRDSQCGSGICNIAGFCGDKKIVSCEPYGKLNCKNQTCLTPSIKQDEESYLCEWECSSGTITCEGICRNVSAKRAGQEYHCIEECDSGRGKEGVCLKSITAWVYWILGILVLIFGLIFFFWEYNYKTRINRIKNKLKALEEASRDIEQTILRLKNENANLIEIIDKNKSLIINKNKEIKSIEELITEKKLELKTIKGIVREREEKELSNLIDIKRKKTEEKEKIEGENKKIEEEQRKKEELDKKEEERILNKEKIETAKLLGVSADRIELDGEYFRFKESLFSAGKGESAHIWIYKNKIGDIAPGYKIHHIDGKHRNNQPWNLIALKIEEHNPKYSESLKHYKIEKGNWESGIQQLKEQLNYGTEEKPFPKHIQNRLKELKEQKKL